MTLHWRAKVHAVIAKEEEYSWYTVWLLFAAGGPRRLLTIHISIQAEENLDGTTLRQGIGGKKGQFFFETDARICMRMICTVRGLWFIAQGAVQKTIHKVKYDVTLN